MWHIPTSDLGTHIWIKLIELVRQQPTIYLSTSEHSSRLRRNRNEINQIWKDIAMEVGLSVEDCKRRWKGLKDVYSKIRKRRVQEDVLGIKARKKWLYEDAMSFMKFSFEQMYQKALENLQIDCDNWKMQDAESNDSDEERFDDGNDKFNSIDVRTKEYSVPEDRAEDGSAIHLDSYFRVDTVPESVKYVSIQSSEKDNCANDTSRVQIFPLKENYGCGRETKAQLRYREIRPKPYQPNLPIRSKSIKHRTAVVDDDPSCTSFLSNVSSLKSLNQIIVSGPTLLHGKNCNAVIRSNPNMKGNSYKKACNIAVTSSSSVVRKNPGKSCNDRSTDLSVTPNKYSTSLDLPHKKSNRSSIELFFRSMAWTVMTLPMRAQAEIKMEICRLVTGAEIQYSLPQLSPKLESSKFQSEKG